ncbi:MAG: hypothetical protein COU63_01530 [Candidatus Pacebacteria bacterium CG10_big_fil_rev_8_21_14_0_10_36_11]|nr:hypothetical protein [Candidatus Pacearchaeota archaeon]OIP73731.1 MAG: hypothetical protein AUK08_04190 [Candidatus Pacebacteria bacterium CG2_30_36_39]PIR64683.1 MAG: hypothetical protein COU63_01530 [Candidatus Pacebacteria bacterium CG10_big_fil_rev_8_21_14_0_10_36_11]PJC42752.1 MAG: hypothetical protein CO040_02910 [Candidatus Pacebacteria bacterium CG_4_9_14_0_2_um_filter_36_8]
MFRYLRIAILFLVILFSVKAVAMAATLQLISAGGTSVGALISISTTDTTPTLIGKASPDATIDITIDDLTVAVLADSAGDWSYTPITALTASAHPLKLASNLESLDYILLINSTTTTSTSSTTTTTTTGVGGATESSTATLPATGGVANTFLMVMAGMFLIGLGVVTQQVLPVSNLPEEIDSVETPPTELE